MDLNLRAIAKTLGAVLFVLGIFLLLPLLYAGIKEEGDCVRAFASILIPCLVFGLILLLALPQSTRSLSRRDGYLIVSCAWLILSLIGALPFVLQGAVPRFIDAFFESTSGFTTTGASLIGNVEALPHSLLLWRSLTHWIGGLWILVFAVALLPSLDIAGQTIVRQDSLGKTIGRATPGMWSMAKFLGLLYLAGTVLLTLLLTLGEMSFFEGLNYSLSTMGTGGFAVHNEGLAHFQGGYVHAVIAIFMLLASLNYTLYFLVVQGNHKAFLRDTEFKLYAWVLAGSAGLLTLGLWFLHGIDDLTGALHHGVFQAISILSTTGFHSTDFGSWPTFCLMILFLLFFVGSCSSSTGSGIKAIRVAILLKMMRRAISIKLHPNLMLTIKANGQSIPRDELQEICSYVFCYLLVIFGTGLLISVDGQGFTTNFTAAAACVGNIGPGLEGVGPGFTYEGFSPFSRVILSCSMIAGRLELFSFLMIALPRFWNPAR